MQEKCEEMQEKYEEWLKSEQCLNRTRQGINSDIFSFSHRGEQRLKIIKCHCFKQMLKTGASVTSTAPGHWIFSLYQAVNRRTLSHKKLPDNS